MKYSKIEEQFNALSDYMFKTYKKGFNSMNHEFFQKREQYKYDIFKVANEKLTLDKWDENKIGSGELRNKVIDAIKIEFNNLVQWRPEIRGEKATSQYKLKTATEDTLYQIENNLYYLFSKNEIGEYFDNLTKLIGRRYDLLAYLCFIKNRRKYAPLSPKVFDIAFSKISIDVKTSHKCNWTNYRTYLNSIKLVQNYLTSKLDDEVYLLDAHSFLWTIGKRNYINSIDELNEINTRELILEPVKKKSSTSSKILIIENVEIDFLEINSRKIIKGIKAEELVFDHEQNKLLASQNNNLTNNISLNPSKNPMMGYDIDSFEINGRPMQIEVKSISNKSFYITRNELEKSKNLENYYLYLVSDIHTNSPKIGIVKNPDLGDGKLFELTPENYKVRIEYNN